MKIEVGRVPSDGLRQHAEYDPASLDMERQDIHLRDPIEVDADINCVSDELMVRARIHCPLYMECARCLDEYASPVRAEAIFNYNVSETDFVDVTDDVRQEIILTYPIIPICNPDCKGLCISCGQNLNNGTCEHQKQVNGKG